MPEVFLEHKSHTLPRRAPETELEADGYAIMVSSFAMLTFYRANAGRDARGPSSRDTQDTVVRIQFILTADPDI